MFAESGGRKVYGGGPRSVRERWDPQSKTPYGTYGKIVRGRVVAIAHQEKRGEVPLCS